MPLGIGYPGTPPFFPGTPPFIPPGAPNPVSVQMRKPVPPWLQKFSGGVDKLLGGMAPPNPYLNPQEQQAAAQRQRMAMIAALIQSSGPKPKNTQGILAPFGAAMQAGQQAGDEFSTQALQQRLFNAQMQQMQQPKTTDDQREYEQAKREGFKGSFLDYQIAVRRASAAQTNINTGTIPPGYQQITDQDTGAVRMEPIPGSPAEMEQRQALAAEQQRQTAQTRRAQTEQAGQNIVLQDIDRIIDIARRGVVPDVGPMGEFVSKLPVQSDARAIRDLTAGIKSQISREALQQMRQASPTGGALGNVSDHDIGLLEDALGKLDPNSNKDVFIDNLNRVWNITQDIIHGPGNGPQRRQLSFSQSAGDRFDPSTLSDDELRAIVEGR